MTGFLIAFEGVDGCGKSTQAALLARRLGASGASVVLTRQPYADFHALEAALAQAYPGKPSPEADAFLFALDKAEHVNKVVKPALAGGKTVVTDRYYPSSIAYQSVFDGLDADWIKSMNSFAPEPGLVVFLKIPLGEAERRLGGERRLKRFEQGGMAARIQAVYEKLAEAPNWVTIDADGSVEDVAKRVWEAVSAFLESGH